METKDMNTLEQEFNVVDDAPPVASSKTKKVILVGCGFCVLLFLVCAGIGLPMVSKLRRNAQEFSEKIKAEDDARMQRLEEQYEMPEAEESGSIDDEQTFAEFMDDGMGELDQNQQQSGEHKLPQEEPGNTTKAANDAEWIVEALAVRLGENELERKQLVNTFGPLTPSKERFLCRWLEKGKAIEMVGERTQKTEQGNFLTRNHVFSSPHPKCGVLVFSWAPPASSCPFYL